MYVTSQLFCFVCFCVRVCVYCVHRTIANQTNKKPSIQTQKKTHKPHQLHQTSASGTSQKLAGSSSMTPATPEAKRNRGRPRKLKENSEEGLHHFF